MPDERKGQPGSCCRDSVCAAGLLTFETMKSVGLSAFFLLFALGQSTTTSVPSYKGSMRLPLDLVTSDGIQLSQGLYDLEVKPESTDYILIFSRAGQTKARVHSIPADDPAAASAHLPVVGTHYLRSTADPLLTAQERQSSKTGRSQYEEEDRDWKAALRTYKSSDGRTVFFVFQSRGASRQWRRVNFRLTVWRETTASQGDR